MQRYIPINHIFNKKKGLKKAPNCSISSPQKLI